MRLSDLRLGFVSDCSVFIDGARGLTPASAE